LYPLFQPNPGETLPLDLHRQASTGVSYPTGLRGDVLATWKSVQKKLHSSPEYSRLLFFIALKTTTGYDMT
ncbi:MAG: hypothetical protein KDI15_06155, partial [Thiothrix sp.]|nr:hypothetical protein [Thiothrix sp.]